jgi:hypothetical protein
MPLLSCVERRNLYALLTEDRPANGRGRPAPRAHGARLAASAHLIRSPRKLLRASSLGCSGGGPNQSAPLWRASPRELWQPRVLKETLKRLSVLLVALIFAGCSLLSPTDE